MARPREFDIDQALDGAISVFGEHGFEGTSAQMLVDAMGIGRQSLYSAFGDKWQLYCAAVHRYGHAECAEHFDALKSGMRAIEGITAMLDRVVATAERPCLGVGSISEFGTSRADLVDIQALLSIRLKEAISGRVREAQREGDIVTNIAPDEAAEFLIANIAGIRIAARGGANRAILTRLSNLALKALR